MSDLYERSAAVMPPFALHKMPFGIDHAAGSYLYTDDGRKILDFGSGVAVNNLGHNYPTVVKAAHEQLDKMVHCCHNLFHYEVETALAERLVGLMGGGYKVHFSNSGAEAVEGAVKLAKYATERAAVIAFKGSFHGRTMMCTSLTASNSAYRKLRRTASITRGSYRPSISQSIPSCSARRTRWRTKSAQSSISRSSMIFSSALSIRIRLRLS